MNVVKYDNNKIRRIEIPVKELIDEDTTVYSSRDYILFNHSDNIHMYYEANDSDKRVGFKKKLFKTFADNTREPEDVSIVEIGIDSLGLVDSIMMERYAFLEEQNALHISETPVESHRRGMFLILDLVKSEFEHLPTEEQNKVKMNIIKILQLSRAVNIHFIILNRIGVTPGEITSLCATRIKEEYGMFCITNSRAEAFPYNRIENETKDAALIVNSVQNISQINLNFLPYYMNKGLKHEMYEKAEVSLNHSDSVHALYESEDTLDFNLYLKEILFIKTEKLYYSEVHPTELGSIAGDLEDRFEYLKEIGLDRIDKDPTRRYPAKVYIIDFEADEYKKLSDVAKGEVYDTIRRIAKMARAVSVHLFILAKPNSLPTDVKRLCRTYIKEDAGKFIISNELQ